MKNDNLFLPVYINKEGNLTDKPNLINREQFENLQKYLQFSKRTDCNEEIIKIINNAVPAIRRKSIIVPTAF